MKRKYNYFLLWWLHFFLFPVFGQEVQLYQQFNGRFDFTFIGNTLNTQENLGILNSPCIINTFSSAQLDLQPEDTIEKAYLYWAGSGPGDFNIKLNDIDIVPDRTFNLTQSTSGLIFFSAFKDVTEQVITTGNGTYTLSELDLSEIIPNYCQNATNFAGWAIIIVYKNDNLPLNQLNVYDGLDYISLGNENLNFSLNSLNVIDNIGAKIGFIAWEGDSGLADNETLRINGNILSNEPLNPASNAFNGTNSITGSNELYNMDLDVYEIQNYIQPGDQTAEIALTSSRDFVMINAVVTKLNSQVPDAAISIDNFYLECDSREITVDYTVYNLESTNPLPANTPIAIYANDVLIEITATIDVIEVNGSESNTITLQIPNEIPTIFELTFSVDDLGDGTGTVNEINENNNIDVEEISLLLSPEFNSLEPIFSCNEGFSVGTFDLTSIENLLLIDFSNTISFHTSFLDAETKQNPLINLTNFQANSGTTLYIRIENEFCYSIATVDLITKNCPPTVYNFISANEDGLNDYFFIDGLRDIFLNFEIEIYNRWGHLVWKGNQNTEDWRGEVTEDVKWNGSISVDGTYFYLLFLNDPDYPKPLQGFLYITR
ncbi:gliding motility-associated C-terminal domain-containing protein [Flavobacterium piscinae]|uniref:Gliding motility-associated C-terminal domain-containing protein n=1 Tax=Flavobacterium piscinae TaxID=2506424 RepID=A0A4Q1KRG4_9FLAO|nr:gliding motility-associated C-terminal domain-containing protein [Flavobacterium piscinae]RXR32120.1 gliding motility-associated C-terminal domain-containing protein [Flavobacterium piscinae]